MDRGLRNGWASVITGIAKGLLTMKTLVIAAGIMAALNTSFVWGSHVLATFEAASEPVRLVAWGVTLFVVASSLKRRPSPTQAPSKNSQG